MVMKITLYGYAVPDDRFRGRGSGTLIDLTYFVDDSITPGDILDIINMNGYKFVAVRDAMGQPIMDRVTIEEFTVGMEPNYIDEYEGYGGAGY